MTCWILKPVADEDDPHWKGYRYKRPLVVEADSDIEARSKATHWYKAEYQGDEDLKIQQFYRSAFNDEKLYEATRLLPVTAEDEKLKYPFIS